MLNVNDVNGYSAHARENVPKGNSLRIRHTRARARPVHIIHFINKKRESISYERMAVHTPIHTRSHGQNRKEGT